jgi:gluconate 2-dehydrogenase gamma chain
MRRPSRRRFCQDAALLLAGSSVAQTAACRSDPTPVVTPSGSATPEPHEPPPALRTFTQETFATLSAVTDRLLPRDTEPGALDLGVPHFIDEAVASTEELAPVRALLLHTLPILDREARKRFGKPFHQASTEDQDQLLGAWQKAHDQSARFFEIMLTLTLEGALGDPKYGGNKGGKGWDLLAFRPDLPFKKMATMPHDMTH